MVWSQLSINKPHLVYIILGGFTSIFMLVSLFIKEKLYIGEATVATICGLIFGPHAANLINPLTWGNTDQITLEFSRIVLVVQCFAVGVELPKSYMERHWISVVMLLVPVMTFGWLVTSLFIWWMIEPLTWLESLCAAACVTATDPVLASSVVGKGKFAKRVPKHIRDLLSAESGCNDGMAFPFIYLALYLIHYHLDAKHVVQHWICNTILYECVWGAVYGVLVGYIARQAIKLAERKGIIDRESFLVFYFVLALFCAGSGSMLGMDDLLIGFAAGVGFSNDGWFTEKTEESHVSNVIDLLLNLTYFVYLGTIIPWDQYNSGLHGLEAWRLVVIALLVVFFRRIPIMLMLKPLVPDIKTWREALFCGHFGPIGVGAIFVAILARAELETGGTTPLAQLPDPSDVEYVLIYTIWPITTFLVITSIVVHGSSIAVFTLGKRINTLTLTLSYTTGNSQSANWMERLPRIASRSRSQGKSFTSDMSEDEKLGFQSGDLPPLGIQPLPLRPQKDEEYEREKPIGRPNIKNLSKRKKKKSMNYGGPVSDSAIKPKRSSDPNLSLTESASEAMDEKREALSVPRQSADRPDRLRPTGSDTEVQRVRRDTLKGTGKKDGSSESDAEEDVDVEVFEEREHMVIEDAEGNVIDTVDIRGKTEEEKAAIVAQAKTRVRRDDSGKYAKRQGEAHHKKTEGERVQETATAAADAAEHPEKHFRDHFKNWAGFGKGSASEQGGSKRPERKRGPAHAYQFGNTIIVEDEDGEVIQKYDIPRSEQDPGYNEYMREGMKKMSTWIGLGRRSSQMPPNATSSTLGEASTKADDVEDTSSGSPDKEKQEPVSDRLSPTDAKRERPNQQRQQSGFQDDGLRMVISNAEQYGLTGLRKSRQGDRPGMDMGGGRRMSAVDFIQQMQQLDKQNRQKAMDAAGMSKDVKDSINRAVGSRSGEALDENRPRPQRAGTTPLQKYKSPIQEEEEEEEEESRRSSGRRRSQSDALSPKRPQAPQRSYTGESQGSRKDDDDPDEEEEDIPTHNVRSTIARYGQGGRTAADARRERYNSSIQSPIHEEEEDDPEGETAAEKRRRLAALGIGGDDSDSSEEEQGGNSPRIARRAIQEPGQELSEATSPPPRGREQMAEAPKMRIQWGGETRGAVRGKGGDDEEAQRGEASRDSTGSAGARLRGLFRKS